VTFRGQSVSRLSAADRARLGLVRTHQIPQPFLGMTVFENVFVAASNGGGKSEQDANALALEAVELAGMSKLANRKAASLGLMDRKRLELARALGVAPSVLLLDEIAGGLTDAEAGELVETIGHLKARGVTIVWIEHIVHALLRVADRLICMDAGKIIADGAPEAVMSDPTVVSAYLGGSAH
jgi:branched-chain amino acid transport system ATP-binding protein